MTEQELELIGKSVDVTFHSSEEDVLDPNTNTFPSHRATVKIKDAEEWLDRLKIPHLDCCEAD